MRIRYNQATTCNIKFEVSMISFSRTISTKTFECIQIKFNKHNNVFEHKRPTLVGFVISYYNKYFMLKERNAINDNLAAHF